MYQQKGKQAYRPDLSRMEAFCSHLNSPEKKEHGLLWENYPKNPKAFLLPIMSKKYLKEIGYYD